MNFTTIQDSTSTFCPTDGLFDVGQRCMAAECDGSTPRSRRRGDRKHGRSGDQFPLTLVRPRYKVLHLFCGSGGGAKGFQMRGFRSAGAIDLDIRCADDIQRLTGEPCIVADIGAMQAEDLAARVKECPDVVFCSSPCKGFSGCNPEKRAKQEKYQKLNRLALHGVQIAVMAWGHKKPRYIVFENVPLITSRGKDLLIELIGLLEKSGYRIDSRFHCCGEIGGLGQRRKRFLLVARDPETTPEPLRKPPIQRLKTLGEVIELYPVPRPEDMGDPMHVLPQLSALNWLRLACIGAGLDWRALPAEVRLVHCETSEIETICKVAFRPNKDRHAGKYGIEEWDAPSHTRIGKGRPCEGWNATADPRVHWRTEDAKPGTWAANGRPDCYGVADPAEPMGTVRGTQEIQACKSATADPRVATEVKRRKGRPNGPYGVGAADKPSHLVVGHAEVAATWAATQDPRLTCTPRSGAYGVGDTAQPSGTVLGAHSVDNAPGSVADLRLGYSPRNDTYGVNSSDEPAPTVRGHHEVRQAPAAVADRRTARRRQVKGTTLAYDERGYVIPTHKLVCDEHGVYTLYGPPIDWKRRAMWLCIEAPDGTWHRGLTDRELAALQSFPADFVFCGPSSTTDTGSGSRQRIGNAVPVMSAYAIADQIWASLEASDNGLRCLAFTDVWVAPSELATMLEGWDRGATLIDTFEVAA